MILSQLARYYDRLERRGDVVPPGWSVEPIGLRVVLDEAGGIVEVMRLRDLSGKKPQPRPVPKWFGRSGSAAPCFFLWDNTAYALGISKSGDDKVARAHARFRELHLRQLDGTDDPGLRAFRRFVESWTPERFGEDWFGDDMRDQNVIFGFEDDDGLTVDIHELPAATALIDRLRAPADAALVDCLVTGETAPGVTLHPKIKGVDGTAIAEVPLVSFNRPAFEHYGFEQGRNAPTSQGAAFRYGAALNRLLDRQSGNRETIADATVTWWANVVPEQEAQAQEAEAVIGAILSPAIPPDDVAGAAGPGKDVAEERAIERKVRLAVQTIAAGQPVTPADLTLDDGLPFFVLGLSPNAARVVVRYWWQGSFGTLLANLARHFEALAIEPAPWKTRLPSPQRLLLRTLVPGNVTDGYKYLGRTAGHVASGLGRAIFEGRPYPYGLLVGAVIRLRAGDDPTTGWHAAVIKACICRMEHEEAPPMKRDIDNKSEAYQLGRLFAVLEAAQKIALGTVNATVTERYYGAASANPARVFGTLLRAARHHVADANKRGRGAWLNNRLNEIVGKIGAFPTSLGIVDQGRFALGYYHERGWRAKPAGTDPTVIPEQEDTTDA